MNQRSGRAPQTQPGRAEDSSSQTSAQQTPDAAPALGLQPAALRALPAAKEKPEANAANLTRINAFHTVQKLELPVAAPDHRNSASALFSFLGSRLSLDY